MQLLPELKDGGLERSVIAKAIYLQSHGHPTYVVSKGGIFQADIEAAGVEHITLPVHRKNPFTAYRMGIELAHLVREHDIQLIHGHSRVPSWCGYFAAKREGVPFVTTAEALYEQNFLSKIMCAGDAVIAVSNTVANHMVRSFKADRNTMHTIYPALSTSLNWEGVPQKNEAREIIGLPGEDFIIGFVGRLTPLKGGDDLIEGFSIFRGETGSGLLAIFGDINAKGGRYHKRLLDKASSSGVAEYVKFMGFTRDIHLAYAACDVIVVPTRIPEAFGLTIIESILCGTPVLAVEGSGALEVLGSEYEDYTFPTKNPAAVARKLVEYFHDHRKALELIPELRQRITAAMDPESQYGKLLEIYRQLVD